MDIAKLRPLNAAEIAAWVLMIGFLALGCWAAYDGAAWWALVFGFLAGVWGNAPLSQPETKKPPALGQEGWNGG